MPYAVTSFEGTPNPNALKCMLDKKMGDRPRSYFNAAQASGDAVGSALFAIPGVTNVLINGAWVAVNKAPEAEWKPIKAGIERVLREAE